jgi:DNA-binding LacI/PurR family transcriptional regulator
VALGQLKKEGWIEVVKKRSLIRRHPKSSKFQAENFSRKLITFLSPVRLEEMTWLGLVLYGELGRLLADPGATVQYTYKQGVSRTKINHQLNDLTQNSKTDAWILYRSSYEIQKYFQDQAIPTVLFGNAHKGIELPALTIDYSAALRHCLASLSRHLHHPGRILLFLPGSKLAGNLELKDTFRQALGKGAGNQIYLYQESLDNIPNILQSALLSDPCPTAIITLRTRAAIKIHGLLTNEYKLTIPRDFSLTCLEDTPILEHLVPKITRYRVKNRNVTKFVSSALTQLLSSGLGKPWGHRPLIPEYIEGQTMGPAPSPQNLS